VQNGGLGRNRLNIFSLEAVTWVFRMAVVGFSDVGVSGIEHGADCYAQNGMSSPGISAL
jgi:hypothetical protein